MNIALSKLLVNWYLANKRDLPWREISDPYHIWISEIILQQTRVAQGLPYYYRFLKEFPDVFCLAEAPLEKVLKIWQGLGYYSRARNMHAAAKQIVGQFKGLFPDNYKELLKLKGIGEYTAAAIASISYNEPVAVVDGNVIRVISRFFSIAEPVDRPAVLREIKKLASSILDENCPSLHNQAIMEFGALHCVPQAPDCFNCCLNAHCQAYKIGIVKEIPLKEGKVKVRERFLYYMVLRNRADFYIQQRKSGDIWEGLFEFPIIETTYLISGDELPETVKDFLPGNRDFKIRRMVGPVKHILTHQRLWVSFIFIDARIIEVPENWIVVNTSTIHDFAVPRVIDVFLNSKDFNIEMGVGVD